MTAQPVRHDLREAKRIADKFRFALEPFVERIEIVGSVRRRRPRVKDLELLFIPKYRIATADLFSPKAAQMKDLAGDELDEWIKEGIVTYRLNEIGQRTWGKQNRYATDCETGVGIDFFATTEECWWNSLVCRTGGEQMNRIICNKAIKLGWNFEAYGSGYSSMRGLPHHTTTSEQDVFDFIQLPYLEPENRP